MYLNQIASALVPGRRHGSIPYLQPGFAKVFNVGANVGGVADYSYESPYVNLAQSIRAFSLIGGATSYVSAPLDANGYPTTDFYIVLPYASYSASAQVMHCQVLGSSSAPVVGSIPVNGGSNGAVSNVVVTGDNMTFDFTIPAATYCYGTTLTFNNTKRTAASAVNTGITGITIKQPGFTLADTSEFMPAALAFNTRYSRLRFMDWVGVNGDITTINPADRASNTKFIISKSSIEQCCRFANQVGTGKNVWLNIPVAASDALITNMGNAVLTILGVNQDAAFQLSNEVWNYGAGFVNQHDYAMFQSMTIANGFTSWGSYGNRTIPSASRLTNVTTITTSIAHGYIVNQPVGINGIGGIYGVVTVTSVPSPTSFTVANIGTDGALPIGGSCSIVGNCSASYLCSLNSYDFAYDQYVLQKRWTAKRTVEMANLLSAVFGGLGNRCKVVYMDEPGNDSSDQMLYVSKVWGPPKNFIYAIGNATYYYLDATQYGLGGNNLQDVTTFGGFTPPQISAYIGALTLTSGYSKIGDVYDGIAATATMWGIKAWQYEHGPNTNTTNQPANTSRDTQKQAAMDDPTFAVPYRQPFTDLEGHGFSEVMIYSSGTRDNYVGDNTCWATANTFANTSTKTNTLDAIISVARTGPTRNLLAAVGTLTTVSGKQYINSYAVGQNTNGLNAARYLITAPAIGTYTIGLNVDADDNYRTGTLLVNGSQVGSYTFSTVGTNLTMPTFSATLQAGLNIISFGPGTSQSFSVVRINSISFT